MKIYIVGSMRNPIVQETAEELRRLGHETFDDWFAPGPEADEYWMKYERNRGKSYLEALRSPHAEHVFAFDRKWLDWCDAGVLVTPAGKSAHMELGFLIGQGKPGYVLLTEEPERWDIMLQFATGIYDDVRILGDAIQTDVGTILSGTGTGY